MDLPSSQGPIKSLTPFPAKQGCLFTWSRPPVRQKFLFSAKRGLRCQLGHHSLRRAREGEAVACPVTDSLRCQATRSLSSGVPGGTGHSRSQACKQVGGEVGSTHGPKLPHLLSPLSWQSPQDPGSTVCSLCPCPVGSSKARSRALPAHLSLATSPFAFRADQY